MRCALRHKQFSKNKTRARCIDHILNLQIPPSLNNYRHIWRCTGKYHVMSVQTRSKNNSFNQIIKSSRGYPVYVRCLLAYVIFSCGHLEHVKFIASVLLVSLFCYELCSCIFFSVLCRCWRRYFCLPEREDVVGPISIITLTMYQKLITKIKSTSQMLHSCLLRVAPITHLPSYTVLTFPYASAKPWFIFPTHTRFYYTHI